VEILRDSKTSDIDVTLSERKVIRINFIDMELHNISEKAKVENNNQNGVIIIDNQNQYLYDQLGIRSGYIITGVNNIPITSIEDIEAFIEKYGDNIQNIFKLEYMNTNLERKEVLFR
jgi:S1-C subfamily serine protease